MIAPITIWAVNSTTNGALRSCRDTAGRGQAEHRGPAAPRQPAWTPSNPPAATFPTAQGLVGAGHVFGRLHLPTVPARRPAVVSHPARRRVRVAGPVSVDGGGAARPVACWPPGSSRWSPLFW